MHDKTVVFPVMSCLNCNFVDAGVGVGGGGQLLLLFFILNQAGTNISFGANARS